MGCIIINSRHPGVPLKNFDTVEANNLLSALTKEKLNIEYEDNETLGGIPVKVTHYSFGSWKLEHVLSKKDQEWYRIELWNHEKDIWGEFDSEKHTAPEGRNKFNANKYVYDVYMAIQKFISVKETYEKTISKELTEYWNKLK